MLVGQTSVEPFDHPAPNRAICVPELLWISIHADHTAFISGVLILVVSVTLSVDNNPASLKVAEEFCMSLPVVESKRTTALSVDEVGQVTSPTVPVVHNATHIAAPIVESVSSYTVSVERFIHCEPTTYHFEESSVTPGLVVAVKLLYGDV